MTQTPSINLNLFQGCGVEIEYMIVDANTLNILPITDKLLFSHTGNYDGGYNKEGISWSNELALHIIELKTTRPALKLEGLEKLFIKEINDINSMLSSMHAMLLPTAMHPWMNPLHETHLWPHDQSEIYQAFNNIFNCSGHGWVNMQSVHLNLPFGNEEEFVKLHAAIRAVLPLIPALAASSPFFEGRLSGFKDTRLEFYRKNSLKVPSVTGSIIPEVCLSYEEYHRKILNKIYEDIAEYPEGGILQHEWLNARGAITRFDRNTIEIRLIDAQETPIADLAISEALINIIKALVEEKWVRIDAINALDEKDLRELLLKCVRQAENTIIDDPAFLTLFGWKGASPSAQQLLEYLLEETTEKNSTLYPIIKSIITNGTLATRIQKAAGLNPQLKTIHAIYKDLAKCLASGMLFQATRETL